MANPETDYEFGLDAITEKRGFGLFEHILPSLKAYLKLRFS